MRKVFCDNCEKEIISGGIIFGYDCCDSSICEAKLTIKASKERYSYPYLSLIPNENNIKEANEVLNG